MMALCKWTGRDIITLGAPFPPFSSTTQIDYWLELKTHNIVSAFEIQQRNHITTCTKWCLLLLLYIHFDLCVVTLYCAHNQQNDRYINDLILQPGNEIMLVARSKK